MTRLALPLSIVAGLAAVAAVDGLRAQIKAHHWPVSASVSTAPAERWAVPVVFQEAL